jgi:hypothetical protein
MDDWYERPEEPGCGVGIGPSGRVDANARSVSVR